MELDKLLQVMERASANLAKFEAVWERAEPLIPGGPSRGTSREYENLRRAWASLLPGLPPINGWTVSEELPDADVVGQTFLDYADIGEHPFDLMNALEEPGRQLDEYRFRLAQARRIAIRERLADLTSKTSRQLADLVALAQRNFEEHLDDPRATEIKSAISEIERLLGDTTERSGRWEDLHSHMEAGKGRDWHNIAETAWPSVQADIEAAGLSEVDPLPVPDVDLGTAASANPTGGTRIGLRWEALDDESFERLLFALLSGFPKYENVAWLMKTRAPDRGRDLSADRVVPDDGGTTRFERVIVQAKHWTTKSVGPNEVSGALSSLSLWEPPAVRVLVIATSGRFTTDAVAVTEKHNADGKSPFIELWPDSRLETLLSRRPELIASYNLRT